MSSLDSETLVLLSQTISNLFNQLQMFRRWSRETPGLTTVAGSRHRGKAKVTKGVLRSSTCD